MGYVTTTEVVLFVTLFSALFILAGIALKYAYERRLRARLQDELNGLLYDYVALEGNEIETINFINEMSRQETSSSSIAMSKVGTAV